MAKTQYVATVGSRLTKREIEVLRHAAVLSNSQQVADKLFISKRTVDFHLANIYDRLGVRSKTQAVLKAIEHGILTLPN